MKTRKKSITIVGGGMLGMSLARGLREKGFSVTLFDALPKTGGLASSDHIGKYTWDRFYHVILKSDLHLLSLLEDLGLAENVQWNLAKTGFFTDGNYYSMSNAIEFLRFPPLSMVNKLRLGLTIFYVSKINSWRRLEKILTTTWLEKLSGQATFQKIWLPLLKSKLGENYKQANAAFIWAIIQRMYAARRVGLKQEMFGYVSGGYATILQKFQDQLDKAGVTTQNEMTVQQVIGANQHVLIETTNGSEHHFDAVVLTTPSDHIPGLCPQLDIAEKEHLSAIRYQGVICAVLLLKKTFSGYYITNITDENMPFTAVIEMTALISRDNFSGSSLIYLPRYVTRDDSFWDKNDEEIQTEFLSALQAICPDLKEEDILDCRVFRASHVLPVPTLNYSEELMPATKTSISNVYIANSSQIANGTMNVNEIIGLAKRKAEELDLLLH